MIGAVYVDILKFNILVITDTTMEEWKSKLKKMKKDKWVSEEDIKYIEEDISNEKTCAGSTTYLSSGDYAIFLRDSSQLGNLAHEVFHVCNKALLSRGFVLNESGESWAYLIGHVYDLVYDLIKQEKKG